MSYIHDSTRICVFVVLLLVAYPATGHAQQDSQDAYLQALHLTGAQRYDEAIPILQRIIAQDSSFHRAPIQLVQVHRYRGTLDEAEQYFQKLLSNQPSNPYAHHALGLVFKLKRDYRRAYDHILRSLRIDSGYSAAYRDFVDVNRTPEEAAKTIAEVVKATPELAAPHYGLAYVYSLRMRLREKLREAKRAFELDDSLLEALFLVADAHYWTGAYDEALRECNQGLEQARNGRDPENQIEFLKLKAFIRNKLGDPAAALRNLNEALVMSREIGDKERESDSLNDFTRIHWYLSQYREALKYARAAFEIDAQLGNKGGQASNLNYMGICYSQLGDYSEGIELLDRARVLYEEIGDSAGAAICVGNMGAAYLRLGDERKALRLFDEASMLLKRSGEGYRKTVVAYELGAGQALVGLQDYDNALARYQQALQILRELRTEEHQLSSVLGRIGEVYQKRGDDSTALEYYNRALHVKTKLFSVPVRAENLVRLAGLYLEMDRYQEALSAFREAFETASRVRDASVLWKAQAGLADTYRRLSKYQRALQLYKDAVKSTEEVRSRLKLEEEESVFAKGRTDLYARLVSLLAELHKKDPGRGYDVEAFHYAERGKARALLDMLSVGSTFDNLTELPSDLKQQFAVNEKFRQEKHQRLSQEWAKKKNERDQALVVALETELSALERERVHLLDELRERYPRVYQLTSPDVLQVEDVQTRILNEGQVLIEYLVGQDGLFVWVLSRDQFRFEKIEITRDKLEQMLSQISPIFVKEKKSVASSIDYRWANIRPDLLSELYQVLLEQPLGEFLAPGTELIIVPDDILYYFPFEILVTEMGQDEIHYLVERYPISYASSASLLNPELRQPRKPRKDLLAIGNPDFRAQQSKGIMSWVSGLASHIMRGERFEQLPHAEEEVQAIAQNFEQVAVYTGREATERRLKEQAKDFRFIHLATHSLPDDRQPMYSKIVLAHDRDGAEDGYLQTYEVFNLKLNAEMVVLSGCSTGLGKLSRGEGLIGMTRAFLYAGVPSLVVSLWPVNDESTALLMQRFYGYLKQGEKKNRALQRAKIDLIRSTDWKKDPFYWGAFVLIGD